MDRRNDESEREFEREDAAASAAALFDRCSDDPARDARPGDDLQANASTLGWSCETAEQALSRLARESDDASRLPSALAAHLDECEACGREAREGGFSARLLGQVAQERRVDARPTDPLFLRGVLAAIQEERPPVRRLEALQRAQWRAGLIAIAVFAVLLPWVVISLPEGSDADPAPYRFEAVGSDAIAAEPRGLDAAPAGPSRELTLGDLASSVAAHESAILVHADRYLAPDAEPYERCRFIPSGTEIPGADTEVQF